MVEGRESGGWAYGELLVRAQTISAVAGSNICVQRSMIRQESRGDTQAHTMLKHLSIVLCTSRKRRYAAEPFNNNERRSRIGVRLRRSNMGGNDDRVRETEGSYIYGPPRMLFV